MELGMIGLGRMGANMTRRLIAGGHRIVVYDRDPSAVDKLVGEGATGASSLSDVSAKLKPPRAVWIMEFNDVRLQYEQLSEEIDSAIRIVLSSGRFVLGPTVEAFEEEFARYCKCAAGIGVASGTDALRIALSAAGVGPGDEVLVPAVSASATAMAVTQLQATPVFVDIHPEEFTMDPADAMEKRSSRTKAAIPVHLYGMPARLKELSALRVPLIEDACQAPGRHASMHLAVR